MLTERIRRVKPSATLEITAKAKALRAQGRRVIGFGAGEPDFSTPEHIKEALIRALEEDFIYYTPAAGIPELRQAVAEKLARENRVSYDPEREVVITPGAKMALYAAIQVLAERGDEVLIPSPWWVSYPAMVELAEARAVFVPTYEEDGFRLLSDAIAERITRRTKLLILNSPCNPTGAVLGRSDLKAIAEVCQDHDIFVISDEIYEYIIYDGEEHVSIASLDGMKERVVTVNGLSKAYSMTGWRVGYACGNAEVIKAMTRLLAHSVSNVTSFVQKAAVAALQGPKQEVERMVRAFDERRRYIVRELRSIPGVSCVLPKGAFYAFPNFSAYDRDSFRLANYLLESAEVAVVPGAAFGEEGEGYLRFSFATSMENIKEGMERIKRALEEYPKTSSGS
ncbi:MAG: pyridoxal phosphate-dependent aminotransferase [Euryarchaeota archaeon]|nr:pyridoxal phosphate-dependent aminotransferase [Euryarchaeota archaeon]